MTIEQLLPPTGLMVVVEQKVARELVVGQVKTGDQLLMQLPMDLVTKTHTLGLHPMDTVGITVTQRRTVMWAPAQTLAAAVLLIGCLLLPHRLVHLRNIIRWMIVHSYILYILCG